MQEKMLQWGLVLFFVALLHLVEVDGANACVNVETSEGTRTLQHEQMACAPLEAGENQGDKGKRFLTCSNGIVQTQPCSSPLRFDIVYNTCNWPESATCSLQGEVTQEFITTTSKPTISTATTTAGIRSSAKSTSSPPSTTSNSTSKTSTASFTSSTTTKATQTQPSGPCNSDTCKLPNCFCYGARPTIPLQDTPMFMMLTFDDAVTTTVYNDFFKSLLVDNSYNLFNPNGCPITAAFYVNHDYTDYSFVKALADEGNEIASHTINHRLPPGDSSTDYPDAVAEIDGMRDKVLQGTGDSTISDSMIGFRSPYLRVAHNVQFDALLDLNFLYDTSITNVEIGSGRDPLWPFTLDYVMPRCTNLPCPTKAYPGFWEVPINGWIGSNNYSCSMIDTCSVGSNVFTASEQEWYTFYKRNFDNYFYPVRVPMHLFTHGSMFLRSPPSYPALISWFQDLQLTHEDVWVVTPTMVIEWMKNPLTNSQMIAQKWGCHQ